MEEVGKERDHEEKHLDNYLSVVGKATGILGYKKSVTSLLITDISPPVCF